MNLFKALTDLQHQNIVGTDFVCTSMLVRVLSPVPLTLKTIKQSLHLVE